MPIATVAEIRRHTEEKTAIRTEGIGGSCADFRMIVAAAAKNFICSFSNVRIQVHRLAPMASNFK